MRVPLMLFGILGACAPQSSWVQSGAPHASAAHVGIPGRCDEKATGGGGAEGCYWNASIELGPSPAQLYWHIDRYPDTASAAAAKSGDSAVVVALGGQVFLETINSSREWKAASGEHLASVGPLPVPQGTPLTARFMEATTSSAAATNPHVHPGPEAFFLLSGTICVETPAGPHRAGPGGSLVLPAGVPMQLVSFGESVRRSLVLVIHASGQPWIDRQPRWAPSGACRA
jgi:mannose-6-phosphate isomerase-like protein (cupin superfamily)